MNIIPKILNQIRCLLERRKTSVELIRLNGNSVVEFAVPFNNFGAGGVAAEGRTYTIMPKFKSVAFIWMPATTQGASLEIGDVGYSAGVGAGSAGYIGLLPQLENDGNEYHDFPITVVAGPGAFVEIIVTR